jgi:hypothetical protein
MGDAAFPALQAGMAERLAGMRAQGGERFDAAGWHYLATLARHASAHEGSVRRLLEDKLERSAGAFAERFEQARANAAELLASACRQYPQAAQELQRLYAAGDFKGLRQRKATLEAREQCAALTGLVTQLAPVLAPVPHAAARADGVDSSTIELKTVRESRATWARMSVDRELSMAMLQAPKNAGPINSHMLILRSLAMMQAVSPDYLSRIVSYVDTLLCLDPGEKEVPVKRKKAGAAKAARSTKVTRK